MEDNENHPLVDLMLARMETHPEEFEGSSNRWYTALIDIGEYAPAEQAALVSAKVAAIRLDSAHRSAMDELLNGEERRSQKVNLQFSTNATERMRIDSSGNVGVETTSPSSKLTVVGNYQKRSKEH